MSIERPEDTVYIVTGVSGFIGFEIADQLCKEGYATRGLIRKINPITPFPKELELIKRENECQLKESKLGIQKSSF